MNIFISVTARKLSQKIGAGETIARDDLKELDEEKPNSKGASVEGERISGVVRRSRFKTDDDGESSQDQDAATGKERSGDDDYVLSKLFRNSNVHSVIDIDTMNLEIVFFFSQRSCFLQIPHEFVHIFCSISRL